MADITTTDVSTGDNNIMLKAGIAVLALLAVSLGGYYFYSKKTIKATPVKGESKDASKEDVSSEETPAESTKPIKETSSSSSNSDRVTVANTASTGSGVSPIRTSFDSVWNYQKKQGVWYTAKKDGTVLWTSLANNKVATDKLNSAYPND